MSVIKKIKEYLKKIIKPANNPIPVDEESLKEFYQICYKQDEQRIHKAKFEDFIIKTLDKEIKCAKILNKDKNQTYNTTLQSCSCQDFQQRHLPCKHMYRLADIFEIYHIYAKDQKETIEKLQCLKDKPQLIEKLIDMFYRIRDKKDKYYIKLSPNIKELNELGVIIISELPLSELANIKYNINELKGLLANKPYKKNAKKSELIEILLQDEKLVKKIPQNIYHIRLNFNENQKAFITEYLYYILNNS